MCQETETDLALFFMLRCSLIFDTMDKEHPHYSCNGLGSTRKIIRENF